jgi:hypothetical protein
VQVRQVRREARSDLRLALALEDHRVLSAAEARLVELAADHDAARLSVLGRHLFEVIEPDLAEEFEGRALEQEEERATRRTTFTMWQDDQGICHGRFRIPARHGQMLGKMILSLTSPTRPGEDGIDPDLPPGPGTASP